MFNFFRSKKRCDARLEACAVFPCLPVDTIGN